MIRVYTSDGGTHDYQADDIEVSRAGVTLRCNGRFAAHFATGQYEYLLRLPDRVPCTRDAGVGGDRQGEVKPDMRYPLLDRLDDAIRRSDSACACGAPNVQVDILSTEVRALVNIARAACDVVSTEDYDRAATCPSPGQSLPPEQSELRAAVRALVRVEP